MRLLFMGTPDVPDYRGHHGGIFATIPAGKTIEVDDADGAKLLADYPGIFVLSIDAPPVDKMIRPGATKRK